MNVSDEVDRESWVSSPTANIVAFLVTLGKENKHKYRNIIRGLLPEVLKQHKSRKDAIDFVLRRWDIASDDDEMRTISNLLKRAIILAEKSWLIALLVGIFLVATGGIATTLIANNSSEKGTTTIFPPIGAVPDCVKKENCISLIELVELKDSESPNFDTGELTVQFKGKSTPNDRLSIRNQGNNQGEVGINGKDVTYEGTLIGTFKGGEGTKPLIVTFNTNATREAAEAVVRSITYQNISENPNPDTRTIEVKITDGDGGITKTPLTRNIRIIPNKSSIVLTVPGAVTAKENSDLPLSGISLSAPDNEKVTVILEVSNGILTVKSDVTNGLTTNNISGNEQQKVTLTGTVAQVNTTLADTAAVTYRSKQDFIGEDSLIVTANVNSIQKGLVWPPKAQKNEPVSKPIGITINFLNPPPVVTVPDNQLANENTELAINGINIEDPNHEVVNVTLEVSHVTLTIKTDVPVGFTTDCISNNK